MIAFISDVYHPGVGDAHHPMLYVSPYDFKKFMIGYTIQDTRIRGITSHMSQVNRNYVVVGCL